MSFRTEVLCSSLIKPGTNVSQETAKHTFPSWLWRSLCKCSEVAKGGFKYCWTNLAGVSFDKANGISASYSLRVCYFSQKGGGAGVSSATCFDCIFLCTSHLKRMLNVTVRSKCLNDLFIKITRVVVCIYIAASIWGAQPLFHYFLKSYLEVG